MAISNLSSGFRPGVCTSTTRPTSPFNGQVIYETDTKQTLVWQGSAWVMLTDADAPPGMVLIKTQTVGTAVSSVEITNAFNADCDNYVVHWVNGVSSGSGIVAIQLSGATTANQYYSALIDVNIGTGAVAGQARNGTLAYADYVGYSTTTLSVVRCEIHNPYLAKPTHFFSSMINPSGNIFPGTGWCYHTASTSYTGFVMSVAGQTMTGGTIRVYGYRNTI